MSLINVNEDAARELYKEAIKEYLEEQGHIGSLWKMERMILECGGFGSKWIVGHICKHPYVIRNKLAIKSGKEWIFKAQGIIEFLDLYFPDLGKNNEVIERK
ncbi:hypothetical protein HCB69_15925 [Listeria booriae]|uniref:DUF771 domain-containing protein n=1 Tax=Listeria booriae TaxID=1552123 RepID=A0A842G5W0_9LIST|nr:hypothetical protein [Listeria booriae]MBC2285864.1 hypothetical protein [Listeria booriae]